MVQNKSIIIYLKIYPALLALFYNRCLIFGTFYNSLYKFHTEDYQSLCFNRYRVGCLCSSVLLCCNQPCSFERNIFLANVGVNFLLCQHYWFLTLIYFQGFPSVMMCMLNTYVSSKDVLVHGLNILVTLKVLSTTKSKEQYN